MHIRFRFNVGECIYLVSFWEYKKYIPYFTWNKEIAVYNYRVQFGVFGIEGLGFRVYTTIESRI